jgi:hypothetical protein
MQVLLQESGITARYIEGAVVWHYVPSSRCSVRWSLDRKFRNAIRAGHDAVPAPGTRTIAGAPVPMVKRALHEAADVVRHWLRDDPESRYRRLAQLAKALGAIKGARARHKTTPRAHP